MEFSAEFITEQEFKAYVKVQRSGKTNMFDAGKVMRLSRGLLDRGTVIAIIQNYAKLKEMYPAVVQK